MSAVGKKCDVCGVLYEEYNAEENKNKEDLNGYNGIMFLNLDMQMQYYPGTKMDLCPRCMLAVANFIDSLKNEKC